MDIFCIILLMAGIASKSPFLIVKKYIKNHINKTAYITINSIFLVKKASVLSLVI